MPKRKSQGSGTQSRDSAVSRRPRSDSSGTKRESLSATDADAETAVPSSGTAQAYAQILSASHEGPIPPPGLLAQYDQIAPGAAARIMNWAEEDLAHSRSMEREVLRTIAAERKRGQLSALSVAVIALASATVCAYLGAQVAAGIIGGTTVVGLVVAFIGGKVQASRK